MSWRDWFKKNKVRVRPPTDKREYVDLDRGKVPLDDFDDATSLLFMLTMKGWPVMVGGDCVVHVEDRTWEGETQLDALQKAWADLRNEDPADQWRS